MLAPNDPRHGTLNGYQHHRCRCDECTQANTAKCREAYQRRRNGLPPGDPRHGTLGGYTNHRCRCPECWQTHAEYHRAKRRDRRAS